MKESDPIKTNPVPDFPLEGFDPVNASLLTLQNSSGSTDSSQKTLKGGGINILDLIRTKDPFSCKLKAAIAMEAFGA